MGEAVHLGKPYLATPVQGQFEQTLNARYLERLGYGIFDEHPDLHTLQHFVSRLPAFREALAGYNAQDNTALLDRLTELLDSVAAGVSIRGRAASESVRR